MGGIALTAIDLKNRNVDTSSVNLCRRLRKFARSGNTITFDDNVHSNNPYNLHLVEYMKNELDEYNRVKGTNDTLEDFLRRYLSNLQPYSLVETNLKYGNKMIAAIDYSYKYPIYIKVDMDFKDNPNSTANKEQVIVSFHEDFLPQRGTITEIKRNATELFESASNKYIPIITEDYEEDYSDRNAYMIRFPYSVGMNTIDIEIHNAEITQNGYFIIPSIELRVKVIEYCQSLFTDIVDFSYVRDTEHKPEDRVVKDIDKVFSEALLSISDLSFTSLGTTLQSVLSYFVDIRMGCATNRFTGIKREKIEFIEDAATIILNTYLNHCQNLSNGKVQEAIDFLDTRYAPHILNNNHALIIVNNLKSQLLRLTSTSPQIRAIEEKNEWKDFIDTHIKPSEEEITEIQQVEDYKENNNKKGTGNNGGNEGDPEGGDIGGEVGQSQGDDAPGSDDWGERQ